MSGNSKIIFYDTILKDIDIIAHEICLEFNNVKLENVSIFLINKEKVCDDNLHFMNSNGSVKKIKIDDVKAGDSLDADFSNISINNLEINAAGGECIGVKSGVFKIKIAKLSNCKDRAVSSGENGLSQLPPG